MVMQGRSHTVVVHSPPEMVEESVSIVSGLFVCFQRAYIKLGNTITQADKNSTGYWGIGHLHSQAIQESQPSFIALGTQIVTHYFGDSKCLGIIWQGARGRTQICTCYCITALQQHDLVLLRTGDTVLKSFRCPGEACFCPNRDHLWY